MWMNYFLIFLTFMFKASTPREKAMAKYKYPRMIEFRDELPKTSVGKVLKRELIKEEEEK